MAEIIPSDGVTALPSSGEMAALDQATIAGGTPVKQLMERAGRAVLAMANEQYPRLSRPESVIVIFCGPGNNGGDGLVVARSRRNRGSPPFVVIASSEHYSPLTLEQLELFCSEGGRCHIFGGMPAVLSGRPFSESLSEVTSEALQGQISEAEFIFDALLGSGQRASARSPIAELITAINTHRTAQSAVISVDLPSGVNSDTGAAFSPHISADITIAIQLVKRGMLQSPGFECCGKIEVVDIGIAGDAPVEFSIISAKNLPAYPKRRRDAHKGDVGKVLVIGGSRAMPGAPALATLGALRTGVGLAVATRLDGAPGVARPLECIDVPLGGATLTAQHLGAITPEYESADAVVIGPGLGQDKKTREFLLKILPALRMASKKLVVDADALTIFGDAGALSLWAGCVITPHPGEAGRILGCSALDIQSDRYRAARELSKKTGAAVVLKGASSITYSDGRGLVNTTGNPWMATPGSGDVLSGIVAALLAQGLSGFDAATLAVYLHGMAGDLAHRHHNGPIIASDIAAMVPNAIGVLR